MKNRESEHCSIIGKQDKPSAGDKKSDKFIKMLPAEPVRLVRACIVAVPIAGQKSDEPWCIRSGKFAMCRDAC